MSGDYIALTGCTGLIGRYLLRNLLANGQKVAVLGRSSSGCSIEERVEEIMHAWEQSQGTRLPRPVCLESDLHEEHLGLSGADRQWLAGHAGGFLHNAANVTFYDRGDGEPWRTNVEGTRRVIDLCRETGIERVHYMSTAFVCGDRWDTIQEDELDCGQQFESDYERSKFTAETMLRGAGFEALTVLRPGAVVGDWHTGYTSTYHGIYMYAQFTYLAQLRAGARPGERWQHPVRLFSTGRERHCFVPVDWVAAAAAEIVTRPELHGHTYHLTASAQTPKTEIEAAMRDYFHYDGVEFVGPLKGEIAPANDVEAMFYEAISSGKHRYWEGHPEFCNQATRRALPHLPCPRVDVDCMKRLIDYAVKDRFGRRPRRKAKAGMTVEHPPRRAPSELDAPHACNNEGVVR